MHICNLAKHLWRSFLQKKLTTFSCLLFSLKMSTLIFNRALITKNKIPAHLVLLWIILTEGLDIKMYIFFEKPWD